MEHLEIAIVIVLVFINAIFAAYEIALASVSAARLQALVNEHRGGAAAALSMKQGIEKSLAVAQLGITLVGLTAGATGGASAQEDIAPYFQTLGLGESTADFVAICLVVLPLTALTIVVGELMPKLFALRNKEWICLRLSPLMKCFAAASWPAVWLLESSATGLMDFTEKLWRPATHADSKTEAAELLELRAIASLARTSRLIGSREENIIIGAARLASRPLVEILLPAQYIRMLTITDSLVDALVDAHLDLHTRFPVCERRNDPQTIMGYVTFKDMVIAIKVNPRQPSIRGIMRQIPSLAADVPISAALEFLLKEHTHIAVVRNKENAVLGMITLEDIVEELVGDIQDEHDLLPVHVIQSGTGWIIGGGATLARIQELTQIDLGAAAKSQTFSDWAIERLRAPPRGGETFHHNTLRVAVRKVRRLHVLEAALSVEAPLAD